MSIRPPRSKIKNLWLSVAVGLALLPLARAEAQSSTSQNLLQNPGFEGDFQVQCSYPGGRPWITLPCDSPLPTMPWQTVLVAKGWAAWWRQPNTDRSVPGFYQYPNYCGRGAPNDCVAWHNPEFRDTRSAPQDPPRIRSGENSQKYFTFWSVHEAGLYQLVESVRPGTPLRFSAYMEVWSATKLSGIEPNPHLSFGQTSMHLRVGIDPTGGTDPWSKDIVWSPEHESYDQFTRFEAQAVARSSKVTVFTHSRPENPMQHNDVYVDDAELVIVGGVGPSEPLTVNPPPALQAVGSITTTVANSGGRVTHVVKPGDTLFALALQYGVPVDQILTLNGLTAESQVQIGRELIIALPPPPAPKQGPAPASRPIVSVGGSGSGRGMVCVQAFDDVDADGKRLVSEAPLAASGVRFVVSDLQGEAIGDHTTDDQSSEYCFADLPAAIYRIVAEAPIGYAPTAQREWAVSLTSDVIVDIQFGLRVAASSAESVSPVAVIGAGGVAIIAAVIGGAVFLRRRR